MDCDENSVSFLLCVCAIDQKTQAPDGMFFIFSSVGDADDPGLFDLCGILYDDGAFPGSGKRFAFCVGYSLLVRYDFVLFLRKKFSKAVPNRNFPSDSRTVGEKFSPWSRDVFADHRMSDVGGG
mgnify:CR=1 FL=1